MTTIAGRRCRAIGHPERQALGEAGGCQSAAMRGSARYASANADKPGKASR